jgi:hypothetical protein
LRRGGEQAAKRLDNRYWRENGGKMTTKAASARNEFENSANMEGMGVMQSHAS